MDKFLKIIYKNQIELINLNDIVRVVYKEVDFNSHYLRILFNDGKSIEFYDKINCENLFKLLNPAIDVIEYTVENYDG